MSSREIAELCDKEHRHVCRDIENLNLEYDKLSLLKIEQCDYTADNGQTYREYLLTKEHRNALADIRTLCEQLNLDVLTFQHIYLDSMNLEYDKLSLPKVGETPYTHEQNGQTPTADDRYDEKLYGLTRRSR